MYSCTLLVLYHIHQLHKDYDLWQLAPHRQLVYICHCIHSFSHSLSILPNFTSSILTFMLNPLSLAFPTHWLSPSLYLLFSHVHLFSVPALPLILPSFSASHIYCHYLYLPASSRSLLFVQKIILFTSLTQNFARKRSVNMDTFMETLLLDFPGSTCSHFCVDNIHGSWTSLLPLLFSPAHSKPSTHVYSHCHPHPFPCYRYSPVTQVSSITFKALLYDFNFFLKVSLQHLHYQWTIVIFSSSNEALWMHNFILFQIFTFTWYSFTLQTCHPLPQIQLLLLSL